MEPKLEYASPDTNQKPRITPAPRPGFATAAMICGITALLCDAIFSIGVLHHNLSATTNGAGFPAIVLPIVGLILSALGRPTVSSRAAVGLATSCGSGLLGIFLLIAFFFENLPIC